MGHAFLRKTDAVARDLGPDEAPAYLARANAELVSAVRLETEDLLAKVLYTTSCAMKNAFAMSDN